MGHTPGPWSIEYEDADGELYEDGVRVDSHDGPVAFNVIDCSAPLIAAAPELLSQLKVAADFISDHNECLSVPSGSGDRQWNDYCVGLLEDCKAAIAKAEGRGD